MKEGMCMCKRIIPREDHTGLCQLDHFISYTGNGEHGFDAAELRRIVGVVASEAKEQNGRIAQQPLTAICRISNKSCDHYGGDGKCELPATGECHEKQPY